MVYCNMTPEEQEQAQKLFTPLTADELEEATGAFESFIFYDTHDRRNYRDCFCSRCGGRFDGWKSKKRDIYSMDIFQYKHGDRMCCPLCEQEGTMICLGRMGNMSSLKGRAKLLFLREREGKLVASAGIGEMEYSWDDLRPLPDFIETARYVIEPGKRQMWRVNFYGDWWTQKNFSEPFPRTHYEGYGIHHGEAYTVGVENIYKTSMRYCQLEEFAAGAWKQEFYAPYNEPVRGVILYLGEYSAHPQLEMLVKLGHTDVVEELLEGSLEKNLVNWKAKTPAEFFRMSKTDYKAFRETEGKWEDIRRWRDNADLGISFREYIHLCAFAAGRAERLFYICKKYGLEIKRAEVWLREQVPLGANAAETISLWSDYLDMAKRLERDMSFKRNLLPEDLRGEHDAAMVLVQRLGEAADRKTYGKRFRRLKKIYAYSDGELSIVVPTCGEEIRREGQILKHCVGGYAKRHLEGKTTILFLRHAEDIRKPYVTIEINDGDFRIIQVHGYRNEGDGAESPRKRHGEFFEEWLAWLRAGSPRTKKGKPIRPKTKQEVRIAV